MKQRFTYFAAALAVFVFITLGVNYLGSSKEQKNENSVSGGAQLTALMDYKILDLNGEPIALRPDGTKLVLINFWATWCPPCQAEIPHLMAAYDKYKSKGLNVVGLSLDDYRVDAKAFVVQKQVNYPVAMANEELAAIFGGVNSIPTTFLLNSQLEVVDMIVGYTSKETLEKKMARFLK